MKAIILAAGKGTRLRPYTHMAPKPLLRVQGKPILTHIIDTLPNVIDEIILVIGYKGDMIRSYFGDMYNGKKISYIEQAEQRGTGHAAFLAQPFLDKGERFLFMYADDLQDPYSIEILLTYPYGMLVKEVSDPTSFGVVLVDRKNRVLEIEEKPEYPKSNLVNIGVYVLDTQIFDYPPELSSSGEYYLTDMVTMFAKDHPMYAIPTAFWHPIGYPKDLEIAEQVLNDIGTVSKQTLEIL